VLDTNVGSGIRVCLAAKEAGLDIAGTFFRLGSEPYTEARARIVAEAGCTAVCHYFMSETSRVGAACAAPEAIDDMHILLDKLALIQRDTRVSSDESLGAFYLTTLHTSTPKLMLNVQTGDYGVVSQRQCGCLLGQLGLHTHVHSIRSFDKLTSEGMNFLGSELITLIEDVLPAKFGGSPTDYQLVEFEEGGLTRVSLIVSPRLGAVNEAQIVEKALETLGAYNSGKRMMANYWREGQTLRVERREPYTTRTAKIPVLYNLRDTAGKDNAKQDANH
jgi:phenylacetate-coenzyme A ligase PaaK-like adenylate-forming protein